MQVMVAVLFLVLANEQYSYEQKAHLNQKNGQQRSSTFPKQFLGP